MLVTLDFYFLFLFSCNVSGINKHCQEIILLIKFASFIQKTHRGMLHVRKRDFIYKLKLRLVLFPKISLIIQSLLLRFLLNLLFTTLCELTRFLNKTKLLIIAKQNISEEVQMSDSVLRDIVIDKTKDSSNQEETEKRGEQVNTFDL